MLADEKNSGFIVVCREGHKTYAPCVDELMEAVKKGKALIEKLAMEKGG